MNVLLSIKPKYVNEILEGKKLFEFRKAIFKKMDIGKVFIYSSSPVKKIVASFEIARIIEDSPQKLWDKCHEYGGIPENDFFEYFKNSDTAYAIEISNLDEFSEPIDPYKLKKNFRPPQSYCYLPLDYFNEKSNQNYSGKEYETVLLAEKHDEYNAEVSALDDQRSLITQLTESTERRTGWVDIDFKKSCENISLNKIKIKQKEYLPKGHFPIVDQGQELVGGFYDDSSKIVPKEPPYIIFGDHTKVKKYINFKFVAGADGVKVLKPNAFFNPKLFFYFIHFIKIPDKGYARHFQHLNNSIIPLPPLPEQRAIVSKIELLFSELDNGIANLKLAQEQLKVYRQAVLKRAFEGELTRKWREQQTELPNEEELLAEIRREREEVAKANGKKVKAVEPPTNKDIAKLPRLPIEWRWGKLGEIIEHIQAGKSIKCDERPPKSNEIGIVKVSSVSWGEFNPKESKTCFNNSSFNEDYLIQEGDFLISRANTIELVGACVIVKTKYENLMLSDKILRLEFVQHHNQYYSLYYLRSVSGRKEIESLATGNQASMRNIGQDKIRNISIPLCSLAEQQAIVSEIEMRLSVCDKVEQDIAENLEKAEALRQSILKKAFEGKLLSERELEEVRKAEDWEPAEVLLERVKGEKTGRK